MIQITSQMRILVAMEPADFRKGIDGLAELCRQVLQADPFTGTLFVFKNRRGTAIKVLAYDGQGFWLCTKRLSQGRFGWWPSPGGGACRGLEAHQLQILLWNGDPTKAQASPHWRPVRIQG